MENCSQSSTLDKAVQFVGASFSVIPIRLDGSKAPAIPAWKQYQHRLPTQEELDAWFMRKQGIGLVCGSISGMLEVLDFDEDAEETFDLWWSQIDPAIQEKLTGLGPRHVDRYRS